MEQSKDEELLTELVLYVRFRVYSWQLNTFSSSTTYCALNAAFVWFQIRLYDPSLLSLHIVLDSCICNSMQDVLKRNAMRG